MNEYTQQAEKFLSDTNTTLDVKFIYKGKHFSTDTEDRDIYLFTLKNDKFAYSANFGDSIHNTDKRRVAGNMPLKLHQLYGNQLQAAIKYGFTDKAGQRINRKAIKAAVNYKPDAYGILSCLNSYMPDTFEEFCSEYGYDDLPLSKHDEIMETFLACKKENKALNKLFNAEQLEQLSEIS